MSESNNGSNGIGFWGLLAIVFIVLKLCGQINWSWWWVLAPVWIPLAVSLLVILVVVVCIAPRGKL